jgi:hypothetical protein
MEEEGTRTRSGFRPGSVVGPTEAQSLQEAGPTPIVPDQAGGTGSANPVLKRDADFVRKIVPELAHMSDSYLTQHSLDKLQKYVMLTKKKDLKCTHLIML